jgi:predicted transcriptional regulator
MSKGALNLILDEALLAKLDQAASVRSTSREAVATDALLTFVENEEHAVEQIRQGLAEAERGEFASAEDVARVFRRNR